MGCSYLFKELTHALWCYLGLIPDVPFPSYNGLLLDLSGFKLDGFDDKNLDHFCSLTYFKCLE